MTQRLERCSGSGSCFEPMTLCESKPICFDVTTRLKRSAFEPVPSRRVRELRRPRRSVRQASREAKMTARIRPECSSMR